MTDKIQENEKELWQQATRDVEPLKGRENAALEEDISPQEEENSIHEIIALPKKIQTKVKTGKGLDKKTAERLRKGQMPIEARLDLHGMGQGDAHVALNRFILGAYERGLRCVLVITGKGERLRRKDIEDQHWLNPQRGVLRERVPDWFNSAPLKDIILRTTPAQPKDGGSGALYVLLRRQRD